MTSLGISAPQAETDPPDVRRQSGHLIPEGQINRLSLLIHDSSMTKDLIAVLIPGQGRHSNNKNRGVGL
jgi:hypothetical protein